MMGPRRLILTCALAGMLLPAAFLGSGCNVLGFLADRTVGPPRRPAAYNLGGAPTSVMVDVDPALSGTHGPLDAEVVAVSAERALERAAGVPVTVEADALRRIHVQLLPPVSESVLGSDYRQGAAVARVRVLDERGIELWPADGSAGITVEAHMPSARRGSEQELRRETLRALGQRVAALFHPQEAR